MKPEDMNTINGNGKAFNGNRGALIVAGIGAAAFFIIGVIEAIKEIFS